MIIICKHTNQLCNRLFTYLPILSYALEANEPVCFLFQYAKYDSYFPNIKKAGFKSYLQSKTLKPGVLATVFYSLIRGLDKVVHLVLKPGEPIPLRMPLGILFGPKWREIRYDKGYLEKHRDELVKFFAPPSEVEDVIRKDVVGKEDVVTVGVHIRRGDYASYRPELMFGMDVFKRYMERMASLLSQDGRVVRFLICSDENIDLAEFNGLNTFKMSKGGVLYDLYGLSACQYIMGVPSTFSSWASFYGRVPMRYLMSANEDIQMADFKVCQGLQKGV